MDKKIETDWETPILANIHDAEPKDMDPYYLELKRSTEIFSEIYAHGKLEDDLGYDCLCVLHGCKTVIDAYENNKVIEVRVKKDNAQYKCKMFAWSTELGTLKRYVALVCRDSDMASCDDAAEKQNERRCMV